MRIFYCILFLVICQFPLYAQEEDALLALLNRAGESPVQEKLALSVKALKLARERNATESKALAFRYIGDANAYQGKINAALAYYDSAFQLYKSLSNLENMGRLALGTGGLEHTRGNYDAAAEWYSRSASYFQQADYPKGYAAALNNRAALKVNEGRYREAIENYFKVLRTYESLKDTLRIANLSGNIGVVFQYQQDYKASRRWYRRSLTLYRSLENRKGIASGQVNMANAFLYEENYKQANLYIDSAMVHQKALNDVPGLADSYNNKFAVMQGLGLTDSSRYYARKSLEQYQESGNRRGTANALLNLSIVASTEKKFSESMQYTDSALHEFIRLNIPEKEMEVRLIRVNLLRQLNDYQQALAELEIVNTLKDSLFSVQKTAQINSISTQYEVEKKEQQIASQQREIALLERNQQIEQRLRFALIGLAGLLIGIAWLVYRRYITKRKTAETLLVKNREIADQHNKIEGLNQELEKRMLRAQMDPHFIFNALNSIQHLISSNDKTAALKYLSRFSRLVRQILESSVNPVVTLGQELEMLKHYLELERLRFNDKFSYEIEIDDFLDVEEIVMPFLLLQPYAENAIVHGFRGKSRGGNLKVTISEDRGYLICAIEDNGIGRKKAAEYHSKRTKTHQSRGISVTRKRLELINREMHRPATIQTTDLYDESGGAAGTLVTLYIPLPVEELNIT